MIYKRISGLLRDAWYLVAVMAAGIALLWFLIAPLAAVICAVCCLVTVVYFAIVRYDNKGNERSDTRA